MVRSADDSLGLQQQEQGPQAISLFSPLSRCLPVRCFWLCRCLVVLVGSCVERDGPVGLFLAVAEHNEVAGTDHSEPFRPLPVQIR